MLSLYSVFLDDMNPRWRIEEAATRHDILLLVTQGRLTYRLNGATIPLEKGDLLFIPQGMMRSGLNDPGGPHQKYSAHFLLNDPAKFPLADPCAYRKAGSRNLDYLRQRFAVLTQQWFGQMAHYETICCGIVVELLGFLARETEAGQFASVKLRLMREVQEYIMAHYRKPIRISELAELVDRSPNYVTQTFKEVTGLTPIAYLHQLRIQSARDLILNTRMTIGEVSDHLGYSDQAHFNRMFKKTMGHPPSSILRESGRSL